MTSEQKFPPQQGYAWRAGWESRLQARLEARGFHRLTDYTRTRPAVTLQALAEELGAGDIAPIQLTWTLVKEAKESGDKRSLAIDLLCRNLNGVEAGWPKGRRWEDQEDVTLALTDWEVSLRDLGCEDIVENIITVMLDELDISPGWIPASSDDPILLELFQRCWHS